MENQKKKCSMLKHLDSNAISYCQECKIYLCNKCQIHHSELFINHTLVNLDKEIFIDICNQQGHIDKLEFYCKNHNILCCLACLCKIKVKGYGQHSDCNYCFINDIKDEKKLKLKENITLLEDLSNKFEKNINELKKYLMKLIKIKKN